MESETLAILEMLLVFGAVVAAIVVQLVSLRRLKRREDRSK
jgi:hypothetical protein